MTPRTQQRAIAGGLIWLGLIAGIVFLCRTVSETNPEAIGDLVTYASHQRHSIEVECGVSLPLKPGDPIYRDGSDDAKPIGMVWSSKLQDGGVLDCRFRCMRPALPSPAKTTSYIEKRLIRSIGCCERCFTKKSKKSLKL